MIKEYSKSIDSEGKTMKVRKREEDTFGWRLMKARIDRGMSQKEVIERLAGYGNDDMPGSVPSLSQLEIGETKRVHVDLLLALSEILDVDVRYLITGEEVGAPMAWSEEAEQVARLVDKMQPPTRQLMIDTAKSATESEWRLLQQAEQQIIENERQMARIMKSYINHLESDDRKWADAYIDRIEHNRNSVQ